MKIVVKGQVFPKIWDIASSVEKMKNCRKNFNLGSGTVSYSVYEVTLPDDTKKEGNYLITPQGVKLYFSQGGNYGVDYLISELDSDPFVSRHFQED